MIPKENTPGRRLRTEHLILRPLGECDREAMIRMLTDARIRRTYMIPDFADRAALDGYFDRLRTLSLSDGRFILGICLDGSLIGFLNDCGMNGKQAELGYFIDPAHWGRGYAAEALRAAIAELFRMGYGTVTAGYFEENPASRRVMEKCGMQPIAREETIDYRGVRHRCLYCEIRRAV